ncbi:serine hydrolase domain-containing protein [Polymorphospora rubra]|uniref:Hydrolase n=1 Tax=Polymorphospora rubra TaxID=338584 RepID=A0A810MVJ9_9ACTN|nr:hydrolase [Polymorphospora rubra]
MRNPYRKIFAAACAATLSVVLVATGSPAVAAPADDLQAGLDRITAAGMVGTFAEVRDGNGRWSRASGVADLDTNRKIRPTYQHRVGSITKTFTAVALLQLVGEGRLDLDAPVGRYLPDLGREGVTVRMLLNHTSGIGNYTNAIFATPEQLLAGQTRTFQPRELARIGLDMSPTNAPGERHVYSNTNYILAGLILEKVTRLPAALEISRRVIWPTGLWQTYFPGRTPRILLPHAKAYVPWSETELRDFSTFNMSWAWMAGELVSTTADVNRFYRALLTGKLLRPAELAEMQKTVPFVPEYPEAGGYGLGLYNNVLPCGTVWGHDGQVFGHNAISLHSPDGMRQFTLMQNMTHYQLPGQPDPITQALVNTLVTALCGTNSAGPSTLRSEQPVQLFTPAIDAAPRFTSATD